ncbi:MAG: hypothetical protein HY763_08440 [Planctomycetes bacterium]|nr:hypothetical protein [Planctomycetota bacterium]
MTRTRPITATLLAAWVLTAQPVLCTGGLLVHACGLGGDCCPDHECDCDTPCSCHGCPDDPCQSVVTSRAQFSTAGPREWLRLLGAPVPVPFPTESAFLADGPRASGAPCGAGLPIEPRAETARTLPLLI